MSQFFNNLITEKGEHEGAISLMFTFFTRVYGVLGVGRLLFQHDLQDKFIGLLHAEMG